MFFGSSALNPRKDNGGVGNYTLCWGRTDGRMSLFAEWPPDRSGGGGPSALFPGETGMNFRIPRLESVQELEYLS